MQNKTRTTGSSTDFASFDPNDFGIELGKLSFRIRRVLRLPAQQLASVKQEADIAALLNISVSRFRHQFSEECRIPFKEFIVWVKLRNAHCLMSSDKTLEEIAYQVGFGQYPVFSRTFKKRMGISPSKYRKDLDKQDFFKFYRHWSRKGKVAT